MKLTWELRYKCVEEWPPLTWLCKCDNDNREIDIYHGKLVETNTEWFGEAVWDDTYELGNFDTTDIIFGSGGRIREESVIFVSSGSTVDRLHSLQTKTGTFISNSLVCLLSATEAIVSTSYSRYYEDFETIINGIDRYKNTLDTSVGSIRLTYFRNLKWNGKELLEIDKPKLVRDFSSFGSYRGFLETSLQKMADNMSSSSRKYPYSMMGTISSGYDSPTIAVLAKQFGLTEAIAFNQARSGEVDHGKQIAEILGIKLTILDRDAWRTTELPEVPFIAANAKGPDVYFQGAEDLLSRRVLMTGFNGGKVWGRENKKLTEDIVRKDPSGLSLSEYRLWVGFIHCPVPFMGVRQIKDINAISNSAQMSNWRVPGDYDRPICRRIVEEAGVPRGYFGMKKKAASVLFFKKNSFLSLNSRKKYNYWLRKHFGNFLLPSNFSVFIGKSKLFNYLQTLALLSGNILQAAAQIAPKKLSFISRLANLLKGFGDKEYLFRHTFPWAIEIAKRRYTSINKLN